MPKIDINPVEEVQARLEQIAALLHLVSNALDDEIRAKPTNISALELIATNLTTAYDMTDNIHATLDQIISAAYHKEKDAGE